MGLNGPIEKITGSTEIEASGEVYENFDRAQEAIAILPDYSLRNSDSALGTSLSGIVRWIYSCNFPCVGGSYAFKFFRRDLVIEGKV